MITTIPKRRLELLARVTREIADAAGLRPDDPPMREHLDAARRILSLTRPAVGSEARSEIIKALSDLVCLEPLSYPRSERDYLDRESVIQIAMRVKRAALRSPHGEVDCAH